MIMSRPEAGGPEDHEFYRWHGACCVAQTP